MRRRAGTTTNAWPSPYGLVAAELGAVAAQTVMVAVLPVLLAEHGASPLWIGFAVGGEGVFALVLPFWSGALSDRAPRAAADRLGRRMVVAAPAAAVLAAAVSVAPFLSGYWPLAIAAFVSFAGLHAFLTPFWALLIDDVPEARRGRVQGIRGMFRAVGLAYGLVVAGLLFAAWRPLPFLVAAALVVMTTGVTWGTERRFVGPAIPRWRGALGDAWKGAISNRAAWWLLVADACWNASVDGIRPYLFLYAQRTLGIDVPQTSVGLGVLVTALGVASWYVGRLGDRSDRHRVLEVSSVIMAVAFVAGFFARGAALAVAVAAVGGAAAAAIMTLPFPLFSSLMGGRATGESTGIYEVSVTVGRVVAPLLVGAVIDLASRAGWAGGGYPAMWLVSAALAAAGGWCVRRSRRAQRGRGRAGPVRGPARPC